MVCLAPPGLDHSNLRAVFQTDRNYSFRLLAPGASAESGFYWHNKHRLVWFAFRSTHNEAPRDTTGVSLVVWRAVRSERLAPLKVI